MGSGGGGMVSAAGTAARHMAGQQRVLRVRNEWGENAALWGGATNASNIYCQEIFIANYMYMKRDLVPDLKSYQTRGGVGTGCFTA